MANFVDVRVRGKGKVFVCTLFIRWLLALCCMWEIRRSLAKRMVLLKCAVAARFSLLLFSLQLLLHLNAAAWHSPSHHGCTLRPDCVGRHFPQWLMAPKTMVYHM